MDACNLVNKKKEQSVLYASFPEMSNLCCAICEIDFLEVHDASAKSNFHWQTIKCRLLIHLISDVIASPVMGTERYIFVITHKQFSQNGRLEQILRNFKLVYQGSRPVTTEVYKSCLRYTMQTKIAPLWNKVDDYFVQGKNFYNFIEGTRALKLDVLIEDRKMCLQLHAEILKIPYIKLEDYLSPSIISHFLADPKGYVDLSRYNLPFVYVLPSTKKAKLLSVSKELPAKCAFKDYDQLRRHWKNMYGYYLPKNKGGILFYEIKFLISKSKVFTYPHMCVASSPLEIIPNREKESTITQFLSDILMKLPAVCGKRLQISKDTPFDTKSLNIKSSNASPKDTGLSTHLKEKENIVSQLELSDKYIDGLTKDVNAAISLRTQLTKIHQIHQKLNNRDAKENQSGIQCLNTMQNSCIQNVENNLNTVNTSRNPNFTVSEERTISTYFKIQNMNSYAKTKGLPQEKDQRQKHLTLKEKLSKAKSDKDSSSSALTMVKMNQLDQMKNSELSDWLKERSIPHNSKGKKSVLINKVLSHIKNTTILQPFRM
ncbi:uncharacterized protein C18orf63-like isoform X6 [Bombus huntii]|uniref:uncharacterized protein C18orf63-like isoform X6 n=1 Tax=Bombus huntii TaxID=85661 RepID=UPI0021AAB932|nr:uncharacterized protein C18orf63-like isoform X6 [Bombus huntii]